MANGVFNIAKGKVARYAMLPETSDALTVVLLKAAVADATLVDFDDLSALLGDAGNTEADFTSYVRKEITTGITVTPDDTNDRLDVDMGDITWTSAGNGANNTLVKLLVCYDNDTGVGTDANIIPLLHFDFSTTTDGTDLVAQFNTAGIFRAS